MSNQAGLEIILSETLAEVVRQCKNIIGVDRSTIFLLDPEDAEIVSVMSSDFESFSEFHVTTSSKIKCRTDFFNKLVSDSFDFHDCFYLNQPNKNQRYITYNVLSVPVLSQQGDLIAVLQLLNKLKTGYPSQTSLPERVDLTGFNQEDEHQLDQLSKNLSSTIQRCQSLYREIKKQRAVLSFIKAIHAISQGGLDQDNTLKLIMEEARELIHADRSRLWLIDRDSPIAVARAKEREERISQRRKQKLEQGRQTRVSNATSQLTHLNRYPHTAQPQLNSRQQIENYEGYSNNGNDYYPPEQALLTGKTLTLGRSLNESEQEGNLLPFSHTEQEQSEKLDQQSTELSKDNILANRDINQASYKYRDQRISKPINNQTTRKSNSTNNPQLSPYPVPSYQEGRIPSRMGDLWTKIFRKDGSCREIRIPIDFGFIGQVAQSGKPLNISFDIYDYPNSEHLQKLDQKTKYRTCSLLCLPIFNHNNQVVGVMELINKKKLGNFPKYNPGNWPSPPEAFQASFSQSAQQLMTAFSIQVGVALQNCQVLGSLKRQEKIQQELLQNLAHSAIYTDKAGRIVTINESASKLLKKNEHEQLLGCWLGELITIKEFELSQCLQLALAGKESQYLQQYYPEVTLVTARGKEYKINLSVNAITHTSEGNNIQGTLVIIDTIH